MKHRFFNVLLVFLFCFALAGGVAQPVSAQATAGEDVVTFFQLGESEIELSGPYDSQTILFGLPSEWKLTGSATLDLLMGVSFNVTFTGSGMSQAYGGTLAVTLNRYIIAILPINTTGEVAQRVAIPAYALTSQRTDGRMELVLSLESGIDCDISQNLNIIVHSSSQFTLPHELSQPDTSLIKFPRPLYQDTITEDSALVVLPDNPNAAEMQSALTVAAGLGNLTGGNILLNLTTLGQLTAEQKAAGNLILVGNAASLPILGELTMPITVSAGQFKLDAGGENDGVVAMVNSPWSLSRVVLVVSGNTDEGTIKAAQAISTGLLRPNTSPNLSIVETVETIPNPVNIPVDQTLADLGYNRDMLERLGVSTVSYTFYIPPGQTVTLDAFFELVMGHSALLNYDRSGLVVSLNGQPIGSVRFTDATAANPNNLIQIPIPPAAVLTGNNRLDVTAALYPIYDCSAPNFDDLYAIVWPESRLHLPLQPVQAGDATATSLDFYPAPFNYDPTLGTLAFILPENDLVAWRAAFNLAAFLGDRAGGSLSAPKAFFGSSVTDEELAGYNLVIVGRPSQLPPVVAMNDSLPIPFAAGSDVAQERDMQVIFRIPPEAPVGYIELLSSPWNADNNILAVLGNTAQGVTWSAAALVDSNLRSRLSGNFVAVTDQQMVTADTRLTALPDDVGVENIPVEPAPVQPSTLVDRPSWVLPAAGIAAGLAVLILVIALIRNAAMHRKQPPKKAE
ncbi:MAG: cellulose biosynthesis cyclic di-GMP-binding regulatory protein BcsB [Chloroflexota bacterium]